MGDRCGPRFAALAALLFVLAFPSSATDSINPPAPTGIGWTIEVADGTYGTGGYNSIALAPDGSPGISYNADRELRYAWMDADGWHNVTVDRPASGTAGYYTSLAIDRNGVPHIGYMVWGSGVGQRIWYAYWNATVFSWVKELAADAGQGLTPTRLSLALDSSGAPHIAYVHTETGALMYASRAGTWASEQAAVVGCCRAISLKIGSGNVPHVATYNYTLPGLEYYWKDGAAWLQETVETSISSDGVSLALNGSDRPRIAYVVAGFPEPELRFANRTATMWSIRTVPTSLHFGSYVSLALDSSDQPRIAYTDPDAGYVLKYSYREAGLWQTVVVDGDSVWVYASLAYDPSGVAHIAYLGKFSTVVNLKYAKGATVNDLPTSSVLAVTPYWWTAGPLPVEASASDADGSVSHVDLYYRSDSGSGWGPWTLYESDLVPPWSWSFPFPAGEGRYEFYSVAFDGTDWEANKTEAEASAGYDATLPASSALPVIPYWHGAPPATVNGTAADAASGVAQVTLRYAYSPANLTYGPWTTFGTLAAPPWSWAFPFPDGEGYYRFHTIARDVAGNVEGSKTAWEAEAGYRRPDAPPVAVASASPTVVSLGEVVTFDGTGSSDDRGIVAYLWDFGDGATDPSPIAAHAYTSRGTFSAVLTVWDAAGQNGTDAVSIDVVNRPPVADAGADQTAPKYALVQLDGRGSGDPDGDPLTYAWSQFAGPPVTLTGADAATPTFIPAASGMYAFRLTVDDGWGGTSSDIVNVTVDNSAPVADAGPDRTAAKNAATTLDGTASYDPDGDALTYAWTQTGGPPVTLSDPNAAVAAYTPAKAGTYAFRLRVTDTEGAWGEDAVAITVPNAPPVARLAVTPATVRVGRPVAFDGTGSADSDGAIVGYAFDFGDGAGTNGTAATASHAYAAVGTYAVTLTVTDDEGATNSTQVTIVVLANVPPTAVPSVWPETGTLDTTFLFDGANSTDDVAIVSWRWDFGDGTTAEGERASRRFAAKGPHTVTLTVTDDEGASASASLTAQVVNRPPVITGARPSGSVSLVVGQGQRFAITASDPDGDSLSYAWTVDGTAVGTDGPTFDFAAGPGVYRVNVTVSDGESAAWHEWTVRVEPPPVGTNWKPAVAATFAVLLTIAGAWSSRKRPWKGGTGRKAVLWAFALTALPFVLAEAATGVVSLATGLLSIPPLLGAGTAVDGGLLAAGVAAALLRTRGGHAPREGNSRVGR